MDRTRKTFDKDSDKVRDKGGTARSGRGAKMAWTNVEYREQKSLRVSVCEWEMVLRLRSKQLKTRLVAGRGKTTLASAIILKLALLTEVFFWMLISLISGTYIGKM
jgi:hypothetical protein